jgi:hypothetical protein
MKSVERLTKIADRFARKMSLAQATTTMQPGEIAALLKSVNASPTPAEIAPFLNTAKCPENVSIQVNIVIDAKLNVVFQVQANPQNNCAAILQKILQSKYSARISQALKTAKVVVTDTMTVQMATFAA